MQRKISYRFLFNRTNKLSKDGTGLIHIEAYLNRKRKYFSTGIHVLPSEWDDKRKRISRIHPNFGKLNLYLSQQIRSLEDQEIKLLTEGKEISLESLIIGNQKHNFFELFEKFKNKHDVSRDRKNWINRAITYLKEYDEKMTFEKFDYETIVNYNHFLKEKKNLSVNTRANHHKIIQSFLNHLLKSDIITKNPYVKYQIKTEKTKREFLTSEEVERIEKVETNIASTEHIIEVADMFLFSCYTGLRFSDVQSVKNTSFDYTDEGVFLSFKQQKTKQVLSRIPIHLLFEGKALKIVEKYKSTEGFLFPRMTNQGANRILKIIQAFAQVEKTLTFHLSRHTFGTLLAKFCNDPYLIKDLMGHADIKTSMIYIHLNNQTTENKLKNVKWKK